MPRVSRQHEQAVRDRIVRAATQVFAERGFHRATMQDIVRESGLSVGAIYTYFKSKSELILAGCDLITDQELGELRERLAAVAGFRERIAVAVGFFFDNLEVERDARGTPYLIIQAWAEADTDPAIREMLQRRRRETVTAAAMLLQEGVIRGELPPWLDVEAVSHGIAALLDGMLLAASEEGAAYRREKAQHQVLAVLETMLAAAAAPEADHLAVAPARSYETPRAVALRDLGPRSRAVS
jgi:AcrR family transcriptional regulator